MSNLPKIGDTIKIISTTLYDNQKGYKVGDLAKITHIDPTDSHRFICIKYGFVECPFSLNEILLVPKQPKKSPLETERDQLEARLALVKEGVRLESEIKTDASDLKAKRARLAEIKKNGGK